MKGTKGLIDYLSAVANFQEPTSLEQVLVFHSSRGQSLISLWDPEGNYLLYTLLLEDSVLDKLGVIVHSGISGLCACTAMCSLSISQLCVLRHSTLCVYHFFSD